MGSGHRDVDAPGLVEQPLILRVVHAGDDAGDRELLFGQQRDDQVVLVITCCRHAHVDLLETCLLQRADLAGVGDEPLDVEGGAQAGDQIGVLLDEQHLVPRVAEVPGDVDADVARTGDCDTHQ